MDRYAVIGNPISHSSSPAIHTRFAKQTEQDLRYEAIGVGADVLESELKRLHEAHYQGLNVTLPHKQNVAAICESVSQRAEQACAVNTLTRTNSGWTGDNTDGEGLIADFKRLKIRIAGQRVLILGAGGAVRGILAPLLAEKPAELVVSNRNPWKPEKLAEDFAALGVVLPRTHLALKGDRYDVIINATSAGHSGLMPSIPGQILAANGKCYDLSYGEAHAPFAAWAESQAASQVHDGLGMLVEQAAAAFKLWRGVSPDTLPVLDTLRGQMQHRIKTVVLAASEPLRKSHVELPPQD